GEDLSGLLSFGSAFTDVPGGTAHWTFAGNNNYNSSSGDAGVTITQAQANVTVNDYTGVYDGSPHGASGSASGVNGEDLSGLLNLGATFTDVPGGTAHWSFAGNTNYAPAGGTAAINITQAAASVTVNGYAGTYDGNAHGATGSATGVKGEDLSGLLNLGSSFTNVPGGTANWTFAGNTNYAPANGTAAITIAQAAATITVNGYTGVYDGQAHGATGTATGVGGEDLSGLLNLGASFTNVPGGTAHWSFAGNTNYQPANGTASVVIDKATPTLNWNNPADITYGTPLGAAQLNANASVPGVFAYTPAAGTVLNAGGGQTLSVSFSPTDSTNYTTAGKSVQINVLKATPSFSNLSSPVITYGAASTTLSGTLSFGSLIPTGSVSITLNGVTQNAAIQAGGNFSSSFATASLPPTNPPYTIAYSYGGDTNFNPASGTGALTVGYGFAALYDQTAVHNSGSTIPIKLAITNAAGNNISSPGTTVTAVGVALISTTVYGPVNDAGNANPDNNFRFDSTLTAGGGYVFNLKTTGLAAGVYNLYFRVGSDPTLHAVQFQVR
ncbi:MAG: hypothetical protein M3379_13920, partial [Acidobacteriota bacterium]|nr:hypothetical protein [Acidobacteriota bacterium]